MSLEEVMAVANSKGMWLCAAIAVSVVLLQTILYIRLSFKNAPSVGLSKEDAKKAFKSGLISSIGPSISVFVVVFGTAAVIGAPLTWMRLNMTGGSPVILSSAQLGVQSAGMELGTDDFGLIGLSTAWWSIAINGIGWLVVLFFLNHKMEKVRQKIGGGDDRWLKLLTLSVTLGLFGYLSAPYILEGGGSFASVVSGAVSMGVMLVLSNSEKFKWLKEYALGIALVLGMTIGTIIG